MIENDNAGDRESLLLKAKSDALRLLSFSPRSVEELKKRLLMKKKYDGPLVDEVIELFKKQGLLDDVKFAKLYASSRVHSRPSGRRQLEIDLKRKGVPGALISQTLSSLEEYDEEKTAKSLAEGRYLKMTGLTVEKKKARIYGLLKRRGFQDEVIYKVFDGLFKK
jgi:regulatory protein